MRKSLPREPRPQHFSRATYFLELVNGSNISWIQEWPGKSGPNGPGYLLQREKVGQYGIVCSGQFFPPHMIRRITWTVEDVVA